MVSLLDEMIALIEQSAMTSTDVHNRFGVGLTWYADVKSGRTRAPSVHTVQRIYEELSGVPLLEGGVRGSSRGAHPLPATQGLPARAHAGADGTPDLHTQLLADRQQEKP